jgi:tetratricopeptide (TPR) repeat protein
VSQQEKQPQKDTNVPKKTGKKTEKKTFSEKLADFISANRILVIGIGIAAVLAIAAVGIYTAVSGNIASASGRAMDLADQKLQAWSQETDEQKKADAETSLITDLDSIAKKWPRTLAAQRALLRKGAILSQKKDYAEAEKVALDAFARNKKSYAAPVALQLAAVSAEEAGNIDAAIAHYTTLTKDYLKDNPSAPSALFNLGRLQEGKQDYKAAVASYNQLVSSFGDSDWAMLAKNRVIYLKSRGLAE